MKNITLSRQRWFSSSSSSSSNSGNSAFSTWNWSGGSSKKEPDWKEQHFGQQQQQEDQQQQQKHQHFMDPNVQKEVLDKCAELHASIMPLNDELRGPLAKNSDQGTTLPFVLFVGNHSSGKSSFINYLLQRPVQTAGVAPTDDNFTILAPGPQDVDRDGPALVGDPDMGFGNLRQFGPALIHHVQLKVRKETVIQNFMLVDSPGMIDSPGNMDGMMNQQVGPHGSQSHPRQMDRGYDFQGVVKWFAERADVVLLFFDPDKPGTTGESLSILLHSLGGMDHKLLIVLNKADQFRKIHDFARAYGSLCWNLSKVIPRKDLPRIYTMCLPVKHQLQSTNQPAQNHTHDHDPSSSSESSSTSSIGQTALADLHQTRDEVVAEVMKAPKRRVDNVITHLHDSVHLLLMHAIVAEELRKQYSQTIWDQRMQFGTAMVGGVGLSALSVYMSLPVQMTGGVVATTVLGLGGLFWFQKEQCKSTEAYLTSAEGVSAAFRRTHMNEIRDADEFIANVWQRVREPLRMGLESLGMDGVPAVSQKEMDRLKGILEKEVPALRRLASPEHFGSSLGSRRGSV